MKILLGSNSPRRNELLAQMDIAFEKVEINCNEDFSSGMDLLEVPIFLSKKKSEAYENLKKNELLITADTVVVNGLKILNKPKDAAEAQKMLQSLSNNVHSVITGVTLRTEGKVVTFSKTTKVWLGEISQEDIQYYTSEYRPFDKAGAYGIQEWFGLTQIRQIEGCFYNVVGLPCSELYRHLKNTFNAI